MIPTPSQHLLDIPRPVLGGDNPNVDSLLSCGRYGEVAELALLHSDVPVGVDLLTPEPFLPEQDIDSVTTGCCITSPRSGWR